MRRLGRAAPVDLLAAVLVVSLLQTALFALLRAWPQTVVSLGAVSLAFATARAGRLHAVALRALWAIQLVFFTLYVVGHVGDFPFRVGVAAVALGHAAIAVADLLASLRLLPRPQALLSTASIAVVLFAGELVIDRLVPYGKSPEWRGGVRRHPELGYVYAPGGSATGFYPDDPRGYFDRPDPFEAQWTLDDDAGWNAALEFPDAPEATVRVALAGEAPRRAWEVRLSGLAVPVVAGERYRLDFRARADAARPLELNLLQGAEPWKNLGLAETVELDASWREYSFPFEVTESDPGARIQWNLAGGTTSVEVSEPTLVRMSTGESLFADPPPAFTVSYDFNALGCRGRDYPIPREDPGTTRILALGDSYTAGMGVHEPDVFTTRLEAILNEEPRADHRFEVINCGVSGYSTGRERRFYELIGARYEPDVVLVSMVSNDDRPWINDEQVLFWDGGGDKLAHISHLWLTLQQLLLQPPFPDFSEAVEELRILDEECRRRGARLAVVIFQNSEMPTWQLLTEQVGSGLEGSGIPLLNVWPALSREHTEEELRVHAIDGHPNEIAHGLAAEEIARFLVRENLL